MGMFDTIVFQKPIVCRCGKKLEATQTKQFENTLSVYRVGDIVQGSSDFAVLEENTYCKDCNYKSIDRSFKKELVNYFEKKISM